MDILGDFGLLAHTYKEQSRGQQATILGRKNNDRIGSSVEIEID